MSLYLAMIYAFCRCRAVQRGRAVQMGAVAAAMGSENVARKSLLFFGWLAFWTLSGILVLTVKTVGILV